MSKRRRVSRSSSHGEIGAFLPFDSPRAVFKKKSHQRPSPLTETKRFNRCTFTIGSTEGEIKIDDWKSNKMKKSGGGFGDFLHQCYLCKKELNGNLFMYGYLGAFCSPKCRQNQMDLDGFEEEIAKDIGMRSK